MDGYLFLLKSKIHGARVVESRLDYDGSLTLDEEILKAAGLLPGEKILVANLNNGARFETYAIKGRPGSGAVYANGPAAHLARPGDVLVIMSFKLVPESRAKSHRPVLVYLDERNGIARVREGHPEEGSLIPVD